MIAEDRKAFMDAAELLVHRVGLQSSHGAHGRLARSVSAAAEVKGLSISDYVSQLATDDVAFQDLLDRVTVQETAFFRDQGQFDALALHVLPSLEVPATIWSAGCSNGQEAYSIAMVLDESGNQGHVLATDISSNAIARTRQAEYAHQELKGLSALRRSRYLRARHQKFEVVAELRHRVEVRHHNLLSGPPTPPPESGAIVFCRNVLIYFGPDEMKQILHQLAEWMGPDGWLFLGYSESLWQISDRFELVQLGGAFAYRPRAPRPTNVPSRSERAGDNPRRALRPEGSNPNGPEVRRGVGREGSVSENMAEFLELGRRAMEEGDHLLAVAAFRKCAYLCPDEPTVHLSLGLALEASGDAPAARRAYAASQRALRSGDAALEEHLGGYHVDEFANLLETKLAGFR